VIVDPGEKREVLIEVASEAVEALKALECEEAQRGAQILLGL
jgi:hypothetical protein